MGGLDKASALLLGRPLLAWTVDALAAARSVRRVVVVDAPDRVARLSAEPWVRALGATVVAGGARRQENRSPPASGPRTRTSSSSTTPPGRW